MALKATIFKADLQVSDLDRRHYASHALTIARHPSETDERMMMRVLAFALNADDALAFGKGVSTEDEPDLVRKDLTGAIEAWIDVGLPNARRLRKASGRAREVIVYAYGGRAVELWWTATVSEVERVRNLTVLEVPAAASQALATLATRTMQLQCMVQDRHVWLGDESATVEVELASRKASGAG
jgi:uncharacterized protein YaeQ